MLIEQNTIYAYKLQHIENPTFDDVQRLARTFIKDLPQPMVNEIYDDLNRGIDQLTAEPQMLVYLYSFGNMHQAKLNRAFEQLPDAFLQQPEIRIVDYGCGQAIGTMCYADYLAERHLSQTIKSVTLIEPSEICLKRAALHISQFFPDAEIHTICKTFNDLTDDDLANPDDIPTLHILSNVLDIQKFDLKDFATLINNNLSHYNQFICVGPYFNYSDKDVRMTEFAEYFNGNVTYSKIFEKGELCDGKTWTAQIVCFSIGELEEELSTKVTEEEIKNGVKDKYGVVYSCYGKRLLKGNEELKTYSIKKETQMICDDAFWDCESLQQITIPDSVTNIGYGAFACCYSLQQITIPNSVTNIGNSAFAWCESLQQITIPDSVTNIGKGAFYECQSLQQITIPDSITRIGDSAFWRCESLQQIIIPESVTNIGNEAFYHCKSLQQITIPDSVTSIGHNAFRCCKSLKQITIPDSVTSIGDFAFGWCESLKQITIPDSVTNIGEYAFICCESLKQITIPNSVTSIGKKAFEDCKSLKQITIPEGTTEKFKKILPKELWDKLQIYAKATKEEVENGIQDEFGVVYSADGKRLLKCKNEGLDSYEIKEGTTVICDEAFSFCPFLKEISIPNSVTTIGDSAFFYCVKIQKIELPDTITEIKDGAFRKCESLQEINIPNSIGKINDCLFCGCKALKHITIPNTVTAIGKNPFGLCKNLVLNNHSSKHAFNNGLLIDKETNRVISYIGDEESLTIPDTIEIIGSCAFNSCESLQKIAIPNTVTDIGDRTFENCSTLRLIILPKSLTHIGDSAFDCCESLQQITIPNSVTYIGKNPFLDCKKLKLKSNSKRFTITDKLLIDNIEHKLISYFGTDKCFLIPDSVTSIGKSTFWGCESLQQISIPNSVVSIDESAFLFCESLQQIIIPQGSTKKFKKMLPKNLWDKLYYLKKATTNDDNVNSDADLPF